jgi:hypothetical protein
MPRTALASLFVGFLFLGYAVAEQDQTLADVLKQNSVPFPPSSVPHLNAPITSYATLNNEQEFLIAYYLVASRNELRFPLFLTRFDKQAGKWQHASLTDLSVKILQGTEDEMQDDCIGSVLSIEGNSKWYYLALHWNPSAGCLVTLQHDLTVSQTLAGGTAAFFKSGMLVYSGNMVHLASVHPETLHLYDPVTHKSQQLYPQKNDPFRDAFSTRLEKVIDRKRCAENNWSCEPNDFTTDIKYPIEVNDETNALAFRIDFETEGILTREQAESSGKWNDDHYVYVYQLNPLRWREFSIYDLKPKFGTDSLQELLTPEKLQHVFSTPPRQ